ncbi:TonB-dependent receptor [Sphingomonas sinipercae]|uniref:TonB-dependent receptor n=1 Tax=Sphingomonas sinipercae TaxID=2714944 RepID=A0A6G7ZM36_9SPHN|nr:TonB-dependent receptor [Sphingomonas sinipercae]QIL01978.1 TonB-dependent receptor [Sphingomonas sinipercae]
MKKIAYLLCSSAVLVPTSAYAQSTGTVDFEKDTIVVTGTRQTDVGGIKAPDATKAKAVVTQEMIKRAGPGQTVLDVINVVPGVSFQNNDAYGNAGGTLTMRGFDSTRISYTLDGIQLNDSGNYNIYSNFSIDPELIEQVNVNLGSTDVDSPTASAVGGTINQRTITPTKRFGGLVNTSLGEFDYRRFFGRLELGEFTPWGTRAFVAGSTSNYRNPFNNYGKLNRQQYNAKIWQPIGGNGDFVSIAGRYNQDRNNFFGSLPLRTDLDPRNGFPTSRSERQYNITYPCTTDVPQAGVPDTTASCGTEFDRRYNPSNSINIRGNSKFSITDKLTLTIDPSFQYTKANGGGTVTGREGFFVRNGVQYTGFIGGAYWFGRDLNGDGDVLDTCVQNSNNSGGCASGSTASRGVTLLAPSQTRTRRYAAVANLSYEISPEHLIRVAYTHDYSNHRQTGEVGRVDSNGEPLDVFPVNEPLVDGNGNVLQKRDRQSYAILDKFAAEYRGEFGPLTLNVGAALPYFTRDLENYCFATSAGGFVDCFAQDPELNAAYDAATTFQGPQRRVLKYHKLLPSLGAIYDLTPQVSAFASYTKNISVPSTDNLYNSFFFAPDKEEAKPKPETTDSFDGGLRYRSSKIQAQLAGWYTRFDNRLASAYDPELNDTVYRNLGRVNKWGIDGSFAYEPVRELTLYAFGSWNRSKIQDNIQIGSFGNNPNDPNDPTKVKDCDNLPAGVNPLPLARSCAFTAGKYESGAPKYSYGLSAVGRFAGFELGATAKRTGPRYVYDNNQPFFVSTLATPTTPVTQAYGATTPAYWLVNLDARYKLSMLRGLENSYLQLNVYNLFDQLYVGGFQGGLNESVSGSGYGSAPNVQIGAPRTISGTLSIAF